MDTLKEIKKREPLKSVGCRLSKEDILFLDDIVKNKNEKLDPYNQVSRSSLIQYSIIKYINHLKSEQLKSRQ